jgi:hypothetical protein
VLSPFARALAYYLAGGFALSLLCAALFVSMTPQLDDRGRRRLRRRAYALASVGIVHPVIAGTAVVLALDSRPPDAPQPDATTVVSAASLALSLLAAVGVLVIVE